MKTLNRPKTAISERIATPIVQSEIKITEQGREIGTLIKRCAEASLRIMRLLTEECPAVNACIGIGAIIRICNLVSGAVTKKTHR
jgi:hypothetical protein